jgi:anti-sigma regulatory factor (Ser/Thr protein kinase)
MGGYRHAAVFYSGREGFLEKLVPFIREGVAGREPTLVVVSADKIDALRSELAGDTAGVQFADMGEVGANPARIIPAWQDFVEAHDGRSVRGIGEPIFPERNPAELAECQHHERLLNPALDGSDLFLVCPYDTDALPPDVIEEARVSHPLVHRAGEDHSNAHFRPEAASLGLLTEPLPEPEAATELIPFNLDSLSAARGLVMSSATRAGLSGSQAERLVLAVGEITANSVRHAGGGGVMRLWSEDDRFVCEIADEGRIEDPLVDRRRPNDLQRGGWGLWIANQMCDLVQLRSLPAGTVARLHMQIA